MEFLYGNTFQHQSRIHRCYLSIVLILEKSELMLLYATTDVPHNIIACAIHIAVALWQKRYAYVPFYRWQRSRLHFCWSSWGRWSGLLTRHHQLHESEEECKWISSFLGSTLPSPPQERGETEAAGVCIIMGTKLYVMHKNFSQDHVMIQKHFIIHLSYAESDHNACLHYNTYDASTVISHFSHSLSFSPSLPPSPLPPSLSSFSHSLPPSLIHSPVHQFHFNFRQVLIECLQPQLVLVLECLIELVIPMQFPRSHVGCVEALVD